MESSIHQQFQSVVFPNDVILMFATILKDDDACVEILRFIASQQKNHEKVSIHHITENVNIERKVGIKHRNEPMSFEKRITTIDRKAAERTVDKLASMSLLYSEHMKPYKFYFLTKRGINVLGKIIDLRNNTEGSNEK